MQTRHRRLRWLLGLLLTLLLSIVLLPALPALAHTSLRQANPAENAVLQTAPKEVRLLFDEELSGPLNRITVYGPDGQQVDQDDTHVDPTDVHTLVVSLQPNLPQGGYRVLWHVVSLDGHVVEESYTYSVGAAAATPPALAEHAPAQEGPGPLLMALTTVAILGLLTATGLSLFHGLTLRPLLPAEMAAGIQARWRSETTTSLLLWLLTTLAIVPVHAAQAAGVGVLKLSGAQIWADLTTNASGLPIALQVGAGILAILLIWLGRKAPARLVPLAVALLGLAALAGHAMGGHAAALTDGRNWAIFAAWLHLATVALWWGGLLGLVVLGGMLLAAGEQGAQLVGRAVRRFSPQAIAAVLLLVGSGMYGAFRHIPLPAALTETHYGWMLLLKIVLLLPLLLLGAANMLKAGPRLLAAAADGTATKRFRRQVGVEMGILLAVMAIGMLLANSTPAEAELLAQTAPGPLQLVQQQGDQTMQVDVADNEVGVTAVSIHLWQGKQLVTGADVKLELRSLDMDMGLQEIPAVAGVQPGDYAFPFISLPMAGLYDLKVTATPQGQPAQVWHWKFLTPQGVNYGDSE